MSLSIYNKISKDRDQIIEDANNGNTKALRIIELHNMCCKSADVPTITFLECAYEEYKKSKPKE